MKKINAAHLNLCRGSLFLQCALHSPHITKTVIEKLMQYYVGHYSAVFCLMQCGFLSDEVHSPIWLLQITECPHFGNFKTALKL